MLVPHHAKAHGDLACFFADRIDVLESSGVAALLRHRSRS